MSEKLAPYKEEERRVLLKCIEVKTISLVCQRRKSNIDILRRTNRYRFYGK